MRGLQNSKTSLEMLESHRTYYNFIRKHTALNGFTPAQIAGLNLCLGKNRWMEPMNESLKKQ